MDSDPSPPLHNSNTISEPAAVGANPGRLMYSHALHLTQGLSVAPISTQQTLTNTHTLTHSSQPWKSTFSL